MTLRMNGSTSGFVELDCQATGGNNNIKLPSSNGSANQFLKNGSTAGTLGWSSLVETATGVGIGSTNPQSVLEVSTGGADIYENIRLHNRSSSNHTRWGINCNHGDNTKADVQLLAGASLSDNSSSSITVGGGGAGSGKCGASLINFCTTPTPGTASTALERLRITSAGHLLATNTGSYIYNDRHAFESSNGTNAAFTIYNKRNVAGDSCLYLRMGQNTNGGSSTYIVGDTDNTGIRFYIFGNGNIQNANNSYGAISDIKLKENIVDANSQWADLKALKVRNYNFKEGQAHRQIGLIAQEAELVSPGLVGETPDRDEEGNDLGTVTKSVNYSVLYMKAVKALQEAMDRIETLEASNAALEARLTALEAQS